MKRWFWQKIEPYLTGALRRWVGRRLWRAA